MKEDIYIAVVGAAECAPEVAAVAEEVGALLAQEGAIVVCGGYGGIMDAAARGAAAYGGTVVGVLSGDDRSGASAFLSASLVTGMREARNAIIVRSCHVVIALEGGYGTLSEIGLALKMGREVVGLGTWELGSGDGRSHIQRAESPQEAVRKAMQKGRNFLARSEV